MLSQLKIFLLSSIGLEMKYEILSVDTIGQSSNIPEPALSWKGEGPGGRNTPRSWKSNRGYQDMDSEFSFDHENKCFKIITLWRVLIIFPM